MNRRRLTIIVIVTLILTILVWISLRLETSGRGPIPAIINLLQSSATTANVDSVTATQSINVPKTVQPLSAQPLTVMQYLPQTGRFLAYGLDDRTIYIVNTSGVCTGLYRHDANETFNYAVASPDEKYLLVATSAGTYVLNLSDGSRSTAPLDATSANWLPNGHLTYARPQNDKVSVFVTTDSTFTQPTEVARVPVAYVGASLVPSPNGEIIAVISSSGLLDDGVGAQLIYLKENSISKFGTNIVSATWSPDSKYLFGISGTDIVNPDDPVMLAWNAAAKTSTEYQTARWFPRSLYSYPSKDGVYWTLQSGHDGDTGQELWAITVVDTNKQAIKSVNLTADANGSIALFGLTDETVVGAGSAVAYQTAVKPFLDAAQAILP